MLLDVHRGKCKEKSNIILYIHKMHQNKEILTICGFLFWIYSESLLVTGTVRWSCASISMSYRQMPFQNYLVSLLYLATYFHKISRSNHWFFVSFDWTTYSKVVSRCALKQYGYIRLFFQRIRLKYYCLIAGRWTHRKTPRHKSKETHTSSTVKSKPVAQLDNMQLASMFFWKRNAN